MMQCHSIDRDGQADNWIQLFFDFACSRQLSGSNGNSLTVFDLSEQKERQGVWMAGWLNRRMS